MPTSNLHLAPLMCDMVAAAQPKRVLDVGPGYGKFGVLLREYAQVKQIDAVEAWEPYVVDFRLRGIYDKVIVDDVRNLSEEVLGQYDLVFMSEVIEHMPLEDGQALIDRCPSWVVISTPLRWIQEDHPIPTERHQSLWSFNDVPRGRVDLHVEERGGLMLRLRAR